MNDYYIKIYVPNETDSIDSICDKFNISKDLLFIFNPLIKHKVKISNIPIKIPYNTNERNIIKQEENNENFIKKFIFLLKTIVFYRIVMKIDLEELIKYINTNIMNYHCSIVKNNHYIYLKNLFEFINNYDTYTKEDYLLTIDLLEEAYKKISSDDINQKILIYISKLKEENFPEAESIWIK